MTLDLSANDPHLQTLQSRARSLFGYHPSPIFELDPQGRFRHANLAAARFAGLHEEEGKGMHFSRFVETEHRARVEAQFQGALGGRRTHCSARIINLTGQLQRVEMDMLPIASEHGILGVYVLLQPRAEADPLPDARRLLDALPLGAAILDLDSEGYPVLQANPALSELLDMPLDALIGRPLPALAERDSLAVRHLQQALSRRQPASERLRLTRRDGQPVGVMIRLSPLEGEEEEKASQMLVVHLPLEGEGGTGEVTL